MDAIHRFLRPYHFFKRPPKWTHPIQCNTRRSVQGNRYGTQPMALEFERPPVGTFLERLTRWTQPMEGHTKRSVQRNRCEKKRNSPQTLKSFVLPVFLDRSSLLKQRIWVGNATNGVGVCASSYWDVLGASYNMDASPKPAVRCKKFDRGLFFFPISKRENETDGRRSVDD